MKLVRVDLSWCNLSNTKLPQYLSNTKFVNSRLSGDLSNTILVNSKLTEDLSQVKLVGADLSQCDLRPTELPHDLSNTILTNTKLPRNLSKKNFTKACLATADLTQCDLSGANLSGANLSNTNLSGANLSDTNISSTTFAGANLTDIRSTNFGPLIFSCIGKEWWNDIDVVKNKSLTLLWKATQDKITPNTFHTKCNNKGPTLTIITSDTGHVFGGYTSVNWNSSSDFVQDPSLKSFLLTLNNPHGIPPTKYPLSKATNAI